MLLGLHDRLAPVSSVLGVLPCVNMFLNKVISKRKEYESPKLSPRNYFIIYISQYGYQYDRMEYDGMFLRATKCSVVTSKSSQRLSTAG